MTLSSMIGRPSKASSTTDAPMIPVDAASSTPITATVTARPPRTRPKSRAKALEYIDQLETLHRDPARADIAWALGIDDDVMRPEIRCLEVGNWIAQQVLPAMRR